MYALIRQRLRQMHAFCLLVLASWWILSSCGPLPSHQYQILEVASQQLSSRLRSDDKCEGDGIQTIKMPVGHVQNDVAFDYQFQYIVRDKSKPTILYLPGGPGGSSISKELDQTYPSDFNIINIDPRGVGCNNHEIWFQKPELLSTHLHALDIVAVIRHLNLSNFIIHGVSYGTVIGSVVANYIERKNIRPRAVVLEGVLGLYFANSRATMQQYIVEWDRIINAKPEILNLFANGNWPFGFSQKDWQRIIETGLMLGNDLLLHVLGYPEAFKEEDIKEFLYDLAHAFDDLESPNRENFYKMVACREIMPLDNTELKFENGHLVVGPSNESKCQGLPLSHPYDSKNFQVRAPIYYFQGNDDPATPLASALYHFDNQQNPNKEFVEVYAGGHTALSFGLEDCTLQVWQAIAMNKPVKALLNESRRCPNEQ